MDIKIYDQEEVKKSFNWRKLFTIVLAIIFSFVLLVVYCRYKATNGLKVYEYKVVNSSLPDSFHGVKVIQFSDVYFGNTVDVNYLNSIVSSINNLKPDIVVFTGDFTNKDLDDETKNSIVQCLGSINSTIGKYSIPGDIDNFDFYKEVFGLSGFTDLSDKSVNVFYKKKDSIIIGGTDSSNDLFSILLLHKPDDYDNFENKYDLVLSGHSLNGQINIPFLKRLFLKNGSKKYYNGNYVIGDSSLYVSGGIGTTDFKYRFNNKPSINLYRLTKY